MRFAAMNARLLLRGRKYGSSSSHPDECIRCLV